MNSRSLVHWQAIKVLALNLVKEFTGPAELRFQIFDGFGCFGQQPELGVLIYAFQFVLGLVEPRNQCQIVKNLVLKLDLQIILFLIVDWCACLAQLSAASLCSAEKLFHNPVNEFDQAGSGSCLRPQADHAAGTAIHLFGFGLREVRFLSSCEAGLPLSFWGLLLEASAGHRGLILLKYAEHVPEVLNVSISCVVYMPHYAVWLMGLLVGLEELITVKIGLLATALPVSDQLWQPNHSINGAARICLGFGWHLGLAICAEKMLACAPSRP